MRPKYSLLNNLALNPADSKVQMKKKCPAACNKSYRSWSESSVRFVLYCIRRKTFEDVVVALKAPVRIPYDSSILLYCQFTLFLLLMFSIHFHSFTCNIVTGVWHLLKTSP